jgi:hypothetical protein
MHPYEIRPHKDHRGFECGQQCNRLRGIFSPSRHLVIRVLDEASNVIETHEQASEFKEPWALFCWHLYARLTKVGGQSAEQIIDSPK